MGIYHSVEQLVGNTPLLSVDHYVRARRLEAVILAKLERCTPVRLVLFAAVALLSVAYVVAATNATALYANF